MARKVKCPYCEEKLDKDDAISYKKRYYHEECFNTWRLEAEHRKDLIEFICELHGIDAPTGMMVKQIKDFQVDYEYKLKGIELSLRYFYEILDNPVREGDGIGIVPYVYEEAKKHYLLKQGVQKSIENHNPKENKTVVVKTPEFKYEKKIKKIDISQL